MHTADANSNVERARGPAFGYAPGSRPLEGYVIKRGLGQGGFGEVYFAVSDAGKEVALKVVRRNLDVELRGVTQCLNLKHPNLVGLYDVRVDADGNHWIVMEYVAGRRLVDVLKDHPQGLPLAEALDWFRGIAAGTAYLHQSGIVHRDLKPANLFLENGLVKLGDYGLAKFISVSRRSGQTESVGTVHYMAPEIANGRYGKQIDIYALGVILYELTTGRVPFEGESVGEILMKHLTAEPDLAAVPAAVRPAVAAALAKDPELRPKTVDDFLAMVEGAAPARVPPAGAAAPVRVASPAAIGGGTSPPPVVRGAGSDVKPLDPTLPHPASAAAGRSPAWYRPSVIALTIVVALLTLFIYGAQTVLDGRILLMIGAMWVVALIGVTAVKNREMAARGPGGRLKPGLPAEEAANGSPAWFVPSLVGVTVVAAIIVLSLVRGAQVHGGVQPTWGWIVIGVVVLWLVALSWLNHRRNLHQPIRTSPVGPAGGPASSYPHARPGGLPAIVWFLLGFVGFVLLAFIFMFAAYQDVSREPATRVATEAPHPITLPPEGTIELTPDPGTGAGPQVYSAPQVPAPQMTPADQMTMFAIKVWIILAVVVTGVGFWIYRAVRASARTAGVSGEAATSSMPSEVPGVSRRASAAEFAASIVVALVATVIVGRIALLVRGESTNLESVLWLVVTAGTGASMLLAAERLFGGRPRDGWARRGPQALVGIPVGLASWWVSRYLMVEFVRSRDFPPELVNTVQWPECFDALKQPLLLAHVAYFGLLFFAAAWWRQTERRRPARLQVSEIVLVLLWAGVVNMFMPFPQPWGLLVAATTATVVQFAAPWRDSGIEKAVAARLRGRK